MPAVDLYRRADQDKARHSGMCNRGAQPDGGPERIAREEDRQRKPFGQIVQPNSHVADFASSFVVLSRAGPYAAKVEAQHRVAERVEHLRRREHDFVVHAAAEERMGMTDQRRIFCIGSTQIEQRLESTGLARKSD